jgi:hypothetical protein
VPATTLALLRPSSPSQPNLLTRVFSVEYGSKRTIEMPPKAFKTISDDATRLHLTPIELFRILLIQSIELVRSYRSFAPCLNVPGKSEKMQQIPIDLSSHARRFESIYYSLRIHFPVFLHYFSINRFPANRTVTFC